MRQQFTKGVAGILEFYPPEGRAASAASLYVYTQATDPLAADLNPVSVSLDTASQAFAAAAAKGASTITLGATTGFAVGRRYIVTNEAAQTQEVMVIGLTSTVLTLDQPLRFACAITTSSIAGHRLATTLSTTHTATTYRRLRALWTYTVGGVARRHSVFFDIVELPFDLQVREEEIEEHDPKVGEIIGARGGLSKLIDGARSDIFNALEAMQVHPDLVRDTDILRSALIYRVLFKLWRSVPAERDSWLALYKQSLADFQQSKAWYDSDDDLIASSGGGSSASYDSTTAYGGGDGASDAEDFYGYAVEDAGLPVTYARIG